MSDLNSYFGRYLYSFRIRRGYESISDFLNDVNIPVSDNYYRDVESGRKLPSFEKAVEIHDHLPFIEGEDDLEYYWHYIKDLIPEKIHNKLLLPRIDTSFKNLKNAQQILEYDLKMHKDAAAIARFESSYILTDEELGCLIENKSYLPIIHFIYMTEKVSSDDILIICKQNNINDKWQKISEFLDIFSIKEISNNKRRQPIFRVPRSLKGIEFKNEFTISEIIESQKKERTPESFEYNSTFDYSTIMLLSQESQLKISNRLRDLISELSISDKESKVNSDSTPYFVSIVISSRENYLTISTSKKGGSS